MKTEDQAKVINSVGEELARLLELSGGSCEASHFVMPYQQRRNSQAEFHNIILPPLLKLYKQLGEYSYRNGLAVIYPFAACGQVFGRLIETAPLTYEQYHMPEVEEWETKVEKFLSQLEGDISKGEFGGRTSFLSIQESISAISVTIATLSDYDPAKEAKPHTFVFPVIANQEKVSEIEASFASLVCRFSGKEINISKSGNMLLLIPSGNIQLFPTVDYANGELPDLSILTDGLSVVVTACENSRDGVLFEGTSVIQRFFSLAQEVAASGGDVYEFIRQESKSLMKLLEAIQADVNRGHSILPDTTKSVVSSAIDKVTESLKTVGEYSGPANLRARIISVTVVTTDQDLPMIQELLGCIERKAQPRRRANNNQPPSASVQDERQHPILGKSELAEVGKNGASF